MTAGIVVTILALLLVVAVTGKNEGMAIWENSTSNPPGFALWDGNDFSPSQQFFLDSGVTGRHIQGAYSPIRDEAIVMIAGKETIQVTALSYSGGQWDSLPFSPTIDTSSVGLHRHPWAFDVRYESKSGNPLIVWCDTGGNKTRYATRTGSNWSLGIISTPSPFIGRIMNMAANPHSNEIVLAVGTGLISGQLVSSYAVVWDGDSWSNAVQLQKDFVGIGEAGNVAYEHQSGRAMIMYGEGTKFLKYRIWNGITWGVAERIEGPPASNAVRRVLSSADPSTNRIVAVMTGAPNWVAVWDGDGKNWGSTLVVTSGPAHFATPRIAVAFEGTSQHALLTYSDEGNEVKYRIWSPSSGWSDEEEHAPQLGERPYLMMLSPDNRSNDIMLAVNDLLMEAYFCKWNGTGWGEVTQMTSRSRHSRSFRQQAAFFMWKQVADTKAPTTFPTRHPTPPPTPFPTGAPSTKPTLKPTKAPASQSSASPTSSPTSLPTPVPTKLPTPAPSLKPSSKISTPAPISTTSTFPEQSPLSTKNEITEELDTAERTVAAGRPCESNFACKSDTCRNGVCMATSTCYPLKHKFGEPFFEHKVNVVFVASGFDTAAKEVWQAHVNRTYKSFETYNMFSNDVEQLNMFRVDPWEFDSSYCAADCVGIARLLCCDQHRALSLAAKCFPVGSNLQTVVIHNDERYGGAGYVDNNIATVTTHPMASLIAAHELGHSLFDLTDEYSYGSGTDAEPNCDTNSSCYKWSDLIGNTPAGYKPVKCLPGCRNNNFYVGTRSFMNDLNSPMGAVNDRFTCCTYLALTKSCPSYCNVFDPSPNYLLNYCRNNDYQRYGSTSYDKDPLLAISDGSVQDPNTKYVQVEYPVSVSIITTIKRSGAVAYKSKQSPLEAGMFLRSRVEGDFSSPRMAKKLGFNSVLKVLLLSRGGRQTLFISPNTTIEVPMSQDPVDDDDEPLVVSEQADSFNIVADTKGKPLKKVRVKLLDLCHCQIA